VRPLSVVAALALLPVPAAAQRAELRDRTVRVTTEAGEYGYALGCPGRALVQLGDVAWVAAGRCGALRLRLGPERLRAVDFLLPSEEVESVRAREGTVLAYVRVPGAATPAVRVLRQPPAPELVDPTDGAPPSPAPRRRPRAEGPVVAVAARERSGPRVLAPPRQADRWALGGSIFGFFAPTASGAGLLARAHVVYRAAFPFAVRAELTPLGLSTGDDGRGAGAFGLLSAELDLHAFGAGIGLGVTSNNEHDQNASAAAPEPASGAMLTVVPSIRIGASDGLRVTLRAGLAVDPVDGGTGFALASGFVQIPIGRRWAMTFRGGWSRGGTAEARVGMRVWLRGLGDAGSVALLLDGGLGRVVFHPPLRARGYPDPVDHLGPGFGAGVETRL
jgi:hypothetical protein